MQVLVQTPESCTFTIRACLIWVIPHEAHKDMCLMNASRIVSWLKQCIRENRQVIGRKDNMWRGPCTGKWKHTQRQGEENKAQVSCLLLISQECEADVREVTKSPKRDLPHGMWVSLVCCLWLWKETHVSGVKYHCQNWSLMINSSCKSGNIQDFYGYFLAAKSSHMNLYCLKSVDFTIWRTYETSDPETEKLTHTLRKS